MFPLHQGKKLVFQISSSNNPHHDQISSEDRIFGYPSPDGACSSVLSNTNINTGKTRRRNLAAEDSDQTIMENNSKDGKKKKVVIHRENERLRRQEMANLCISLRSLLPLEFIKGKRSTSDHMNEAVNYIKHLQNRIMTLGAKRDKLEKFPILISSTATGRDGTAGSSSNWDNRDEPSCFRIQPCCGGVQIVISSGSREDGASPLISISISKILEMLLQQGLNVVSCVSSKVNERVVHTIQSEVDEIESVDMSRLENKLAEVLLFSSRCISK